MSTQAFQDEAEGILLRDSGKRINPDSIFTLWFTVIGATALAVTSFLVSFSGLTAIAAWTGIPVWMAWAVPVFIDMAIIVYSLAILVHRSRGERTTASWVSLTGFTIVSVAANASHALSLPQDVAWHGWVGAGIAGLAPVAVFAAVEELGRLVIEQPRQGRARRPAAAKKRETRPTPRAVVRTPASITVPTPERVVVPVELPANVTAMPERPRAGAGFAEWVAEQIAATGNAPSGTTVAGFFQSQGEQITDRTGRNRLAELRTSRPEIFGTDSAEVTR